MLGINAHVNYDLPQAMLAVISIADFDDPILIGRRKRDHECIDKVLAGRVGAEEDNLSADQTRLDKILAPLNRLGSKRGSCARRGRRCGTTWANCTSRDWRR